MQADLAAATVLKNLRQPLKVIELLKPYVGKQGGASVSVLTMYADAMRDTGIVPDMAALMEPLLSRPDGRAAWMRFAVSNLPPLEAQGWLEMARSRWAMRRMRQGVADHVVLAEMYGVLSGGIRRGLMQKVRENSTRWWR